MTEVEGFGKIYCDDLHTGMMSFFANIVYQI